MRSTEHRVFTRVEREDVAVGADVASPDVETPGEDHLAILLGKSYAEAIAARFHGITVVVEPVHKQETGSSALSRIESARVRATT